MIHRYETEEMRGIWSDENRFNAWLEVEIAACRAWAEEGVIPGEHMEAIESRAGFDVDRIRQIEEVTQHDVIAFVSAVAERVGESGRYIHLGLTSSDVVDTASSLLLYRSSKVILQEMEELLKILGDLAVSHKFTPCAGRTHGVHAEPMTFGLKLLNHYAQIKRDFSRIKSASEEIRVGKISGAVGTYANCPPHIEAKVCESLGLRRDEVSNQIIQRDRHCSLLCSLAIMGGSLERLALEIRHLQRTEVLEALEPFGKGQKGSSAMPHKKNPILCERICGMARLLRSYALTSMENIALWHERDISHSSTERVIWPDAFHVSHFMIRSAKKVLSGLTVDQDRMRQNMDMTGGLLFSGRVLLFLVERLGMSREEAYSVVQDNAMRCWNTGERLLDLLAADGRLKAVPKEELESLFDVGFFTRHVEEVFSRFPELN
ncbi:MAG: adenylosuccinate lyase [Thermanaerothrix sp.]|nr:adenylosuccinate lyase [Thermanaerothrix sp.]